MAKLMAEKPQNPYQEKDALKTTILQLLNTFPEKRWDHGALEDTTMYTLPEIVCACSELESEGIIERAEKKG